MGTFKSNLNGISRTYGLTALKDRLTTCFHNWRSKTVQAHQQFERAHHKDYGYVRTSESFNSFNTTFRKIFSPTKQRGKSERVQIVTKLVSSTLIAASAGSACCREQESLSEADGDMTITDDTFLDIRAEYPYMDAEVRSILMARSQEGATISEIKDDYRKNTGVKFPVVNNITEFLLSIPSVMAYCNEQGTRVFNVMPSAKTKHIFDMIQQQKPIQEQPDNRFPHFAGRKGLPSYLFKAANQHSNYEQLLHNNYNKNSQIKKHLDEDYRFIENACNVRTTPVSANQMEVDPQPLGLQPAEMDVDISASEADDSPGNHYYQDNCKYLFNRLYNPPSASIRTGHNFQTINNAGKKTLNTNNGLTKAPTIGKTGSYALNQLNNLSKQPLEPLAGTQQNFSNNNNNNNNKRKRVNTLSQPALPRPSHTSSPTYTKSSRNNDSLYMADLDYEAHLLDFPLLGDDFFLYLARMELRCKFRKFEKVLQSGLCVSGQTIRGAIKRVQQMDDCAKHVIVNIGSVDIMKGRPLVQIEHDFRELIEALCRKGLTPILTTLAPLANYAHISQMKEKLERFNQFIKKSAKYLQVIDIWACLVNDRGAILFDCYQNEPRWVTGTSEAYVFWNKIGRQRVLQLIESNLEY